MGEFTLPHLFKGEHRMETKMAVKYGIIALLVLTGLIFWGDLVNLAETRIFGVAQQNAQRKVFEQSQSYNEGMIRDLENLKTQYTTATPEQKEALKATIIHRFEVYPKGKLPEDLELFYGSLR